MGASFGFGIAIVGLEQAAGCASLPDALVRG
jgi:hypothetical protein